MLPGIIHEFIRALNEEIEAIKKGGGGSIVTLFNGRFLRAISGLYIYLFNLENFLIVLDETPAEIEVSGKRYPSHILIAQGLEVEIGIEQNLGQYIPQARLQTNIWYLLELLKKKYIECRDSSSRQDFQLSEVIFSGHSASPKTTQESEIKYSPSMPLPNPSQQQAIESSFSSKLSIIWGPPGTGKTKTIAKAIEAHLIAGRRVLLVSHANNAVDEALKDLAAHLKHTQFYQQGKIIRLGKPQEEFLKELEQDYPLVLLDKIAEKMGETLTKEKMTLENEKTKIEIFLANSEEVLKAIHVLKTLSTEAKSLASAILEYTEKLDNINDEIKHIMEKLDGDKKRYLEATSSGTILRILKGLNPQKIQRKIDQSQTTMDYKKRMASEISNRISEMKNILNNKELDTKKAKSDADLLLRKYNISSIDNIVECSSCKTKNRIINYLINGKYFCGKCKAELPSYPLVQYSLEDIEHQKKRLDKRKDEIFARMSEINRKLEEIQKNALSEAKLVATTLTKTFSAKQFPDTPFDVLFLDEASMAPLPHLYWAAGRCRQFSTIVGDFLQLPPICISDKAMAQKWLGRSIFTVLGINSVLDGCRDERVKMLDMQYRMHPNISAIPKRFFYQNKINDHHSTANLRLDDGFSSSPLVLIETGAMSPWCSQVSPRGRFNLYNAVVSANLAKKLILKINNIRNACNNPNAKIGIMTPYRHQAFLIQKIAKDWNILDFVRISTVHRFQGGEEPIIIFDSCEGLGLKVAPMLSETKPDSDAPLLLNVAFTRAQHRFYFIGHTAHLLSNMNQRAVLKRIIPYLLEKAEIINSEKLVDNYFTTDFEKWAEEFLATPRVKTCPLSGDLFTERNFWAQFFRDLKEVRKRLIILSPFATLRRSNMLINYFQSMKDRGIEIKIITRPISQQIGKMAEQADIVIEKLRRMGCKVLEKRSMHQKVAIFDTSIVWEGSLNILSHQDTGEQMRRFEGKDSVEEIIRDLELDDESPIGTQTEEKCPGSDRSPNCKGYLVVRTKYNRRFYGCSNYPKCNYTRPINGHAQKKR
jgi:superfamily I DNA and/or RNA helicase